MAGTESVWADDPGVLGIPRSRQTVASIYPQYVPDSQDFPSALRTGLDRSVSVATPSPGQCSARAAQDIWEHHRPAVGSSMRALCGRTQHLREATLDGSRETHRAREPRGAGTGADGRAAGPAPRHGTRTGVLALPDANRRLVGGRCLTRYRNQPDKSLHQSGAAMHHRPQDQERALSLSIPAASGPGNIPRVESN